MSGYIKLGRKVFDTPFGGDDELIGFYARLATKAVYKPTLYKRHLLQPGQFGFTWRTVSSFLYGEDTKNKPAMNTIKARLETLAEVGVIALEVHPSSRFSIVTIKASSVSKIDTVIGSRNLMNSKPSRKRDEPQ